MKNKKSIIIIVVLLLIVIVSGTMAWLSYQSKKTALVLVLGDDDSFVITIDPYHYEGTLPSSVDYSQLSNYSSVSANNASVFEHNFYFYYRTNEVDEELLNGSLKFAITRSTSLSGTYTEIVSGTFNSSNTARDYFVFEDTVPAGTTYYYKGYIYIDGSTDNSALIDKTVNMEFRVTFELTGAQMLVNKSNSVDITTYSSGDTGEMYMFSQPETEQLAATTDYRYIGANPNNYIEFNDETWRIIGVFDDKIKIIKDSPLNDISWDYKMTGVGSSEYEYGSNDWVDSQLMYMLNPNDIEANVALKSGYTYTNNIVKDANDYIIYQNGCVPAAVSTTTTSYSCTDSPWSLSSEAYKQVADTTYYLGGLGIPFSELSDVEAFNATLLSKTTTDFYMFERGTAKYNDSRSLNWNGKVGLMYPSDYAYTFAYGVDNSCYNSPMGCGTVSGTPTTSWLYNAVYNKWTINSIFVYSIPEYSYLLFYLSDDGSINYDVAHHAHGDARPVVYLKSDIQLQGTGTSEDKYTIVTTGAELLISKANDTSITTYTSGDTGEMYMFSQPETEQLAATIDYRYIGDSPNNYIEFNDETWRIIGVFDDRIKIIKDTSIEIIPWDYKLQEVGSSESIYGSNDWTDSQLMYMLNPNDIEANVALKSGYTYSDNLVKDSNNHIIYQNGCLPTTVSITTTSYSCTTSTWSLNSTALTQVADATYYLGSSSSGSGHSAQSYYSFERGNAKYNDSRSLNWTGKVGLMYPSDYAYTFAYGVNAKCYTDIHNCNTGNPSSSWLYSNIWQWTIAPVSGVPDGVFIMSNDGGVYYGSAFGSNGVSPVVYLKSDIQLQGTGTNDENIYKIVE